MAETETDGQPPGPALKTPRARPKRAATFLGRLAHALREQNWTAVALGFTIVVLGVVIGFQVTAWGNERTASLQAVHLRSGPVVYRGSTWLQAG